MCGGGCGDADKGCALILMCNTIQLWEVGCLRGWSFGGVHIRCCGNGCLGFRSYSGSLLERPKSNQKVFAPTLGASLWLGMPAIRH